MATPIARYRINEAASGQTPTHVLDSISDPDNLEIVYVGSVPEYTEIASGRGLSFPSQSSPQGAGAYSVRLEPGVKVYDALEGSTTATITVVADLVTLSNYNGINPCNLFGIVRWDGEYDALLLWIWDDVLWFDWTGSDGDPSTYFARAYDLTDIGTGLHVITGVIDTTEASEPNRMRLYCDGELLTPVGGEGTVPQNQTIHIQLDASTPDFLTPAGDRYDCLLSLGSYEDYLAGNGGFLGSIYYADLYDVALTPSEVGDAATALLSDNDQDEEPPGEIPTMSTLSTAARNAACDAVVDLVDAGTGAGNLVIKDGSTVLVTIALEATAFGDATNGTATAAGFPKTQAVSAAGEADNFEITDGDDTVVISGTVGQGSGEISLDNVNIASGQDVTINSLTHTQPAS